MGRQNCTFNSTANDYQCDSSDIEVLIYYYTTKESQYSKTVLQEKGLLSYEQVGSTMEITMPQVTAEAGQNVFQVNANYTVFVSEQRHDFSQMQSVCFLTRMVPNQKVKVEVKNNESKVILSNLESNKNYYIGVLAKNEDNKERYAFKPIQLFYKTGGLPTFMLVVIMITILILVILVVYFYRKFKFTKKVLTYEQSDIRNMGSVPRSEAELKTIVKENEVKKYTSLTEEASKV
jgi:hypothetical protein